MSEALSAGSGGRWRIAADTGGTFTDAIGIDPDGRRHRAKVLSSGALRVEWSGARGLRWDVTGGPPVPPGFLRGAEVADAEGPLGRIADDALGEGWIELADATREPAPGACLTLRTGEEAPVLAARLLTRTPAGRPLPALDLRLGTTRGTNALLERKGARVALFLTAGFGDLPRIRDQQRPRLFARVARPDDGLEPLVFELPGRLAADGRELLPLDLAALEAAVLEARAAGCEAAAVSLLHAYQNASHEDAVLARLRAAGFAYVAGSAELRPFIHYLQRTETVLVDATLGPILEAYLGAIERDLGGAPVQVMTSGGGLVPRRRFRAKDSLLSGPAGGVGGAAAEARRQGLARVLTFDMGGTSTDVARWAGDFAFQETLTVGPARILARSVRVETVAAGGGSICRVRDGRLLVGPQSAGADPGPACYGAGGPLTVTDLNLLLGRLDPSAFSIPLDPAAAERALEAELVGLTDPPPRVELLEGWLAIANQRMAEAIRKVSVRDGYDPAEHALIAFGGAGGMHACAVAEALGIATISFPDNAGLLSAEGIAEAALEALAERQWLAPLAGAEGELARTRGELLAEAGAALLADGIEAARQVTLDASVDLRLAGQESALTVPWEGDLAAAFGARYEEVFGYAPAARPLEVVTLRIRRGECRENPATEDFPAHGPEPVPERRGAAGFAGVVRELPVHRRDALAPGVRIEGPALVLDAYSTLVIAPGWTARKGSGGTVRLDRVAASPSVTADAAGSSASALVARELLLHRFYGLVGAMGEQLRRTALSPNIRERLDYSCALLDAEGTLLVNAPHIPVHLGALGECARSVLRRQTLRPGDIVVTNHPAYGGSHLPDVTVLQGIFDQRGDLLAILANRAHHAEWGGRRPGSMPAEARTLVEEGVVLSPRLLFDQGVARWEALEAELRDAPFPSRAVAENLADVQAQVASLRTGESALRRLLAERGEAAVREFLAEAGTLAGATARRVLAALPPVEAVVRDTLDDGTPLCLRLTVRAGRMRCDFGGTGAVHPGNLNATPAIVRSAVLYVMRLLVDEDVPLNEGLLEPVEIVLPAGLLDPPFPADPARCPAVVGGNVETSQRLVDLLTAALGLCANGPGTMNNVLFGADRFGAYETIGGGAGAGPGEAGGSGLHVHMSNTAITDPEILESRYPVRLWRFALRPGSGGQGRWPGGDGLVREYEWLRPLSISLLTQRRAAGPRGAAGGGSGQPGAQARRRPGAENWEPLPAIVSWDAEAGERLRVETPGGGGWGSLEGG
jgi:5-oxoprolinase (ATP-hydrolysing)